MVVVVLVVVEEWVGRWVGCGEGEASGRVDGAEDGVRIAGLQVEVAEIRVRIARRCASEVRVNFSSFKGCFCCYLHGPSKRTASVFIYFPGYYALSLRPRSF